MAGELAGVSLAELRALVEEAKRKAAFILVVRTIRLSGPETWEIESESEEGHYYVVQKNLCNCRDYQLGASESPEPFTTKAPGGWCKHRLALLMKAKLEEKVRQRLATVDEKLAQLMPAIRLAVTA
jgi:hypothetical protein